MEKYQQEYQQGQKLAKEISQAILENKNKIDLEELSTLKDFIENNPNAGDFLEKMSNEEYLKKGVLEFQSNIPQTPQLLNRLNKIKSHKLIRRISYIASGIAAILIIGLYIIQSSPKTEQYTVYQATNHTIPTLILNNGEEIKLDKKQNNLQLSQPVEYADSERITYKKNKISDKNTLIIPSQHMYELTLEDGTKVLLNANSEIKYPTCFTDKNREVQLRGEAYFTVSKSNRPFIVHTNNIKIQVYGTEFNINTNKTNCMEALLIKGSIGAIFNNGEELKMNPNELLTLSKDNQNRTLAKVNPQRYIAWKEGNFACTLEPLYSFLDDISAWYGISFSYPDIKIKNKRVSVQINRNTEINRLLETLQEILQVEFIKEKDGVYMVK